MSFYLKYWKKEQPTNKDPHQKEPLQSKGALYIIITINIFKKSLYSTFANHYLTLPSRFHGKGIFYLEIAERNINEGRKQENDKFKFTYQL